MFPYRPDQQKLRPTFWYMTYVGNGEAAEMGPHCM